MADLIDSTDTEILIELQRRFASGVIAGQNKDETENLYYWWGDRVTSLGFCNRLSYGVNADMSGDLFDEDDSEDVETVETTPQPYGIYL